MYAGAGDLADGVERGQSGAALEIYQYSAAEIVSRRNDRYRLLRYVQVLFATALMDLRKTLAQPGDRLNGDRVDAEEQADRGGQPHVPEQKMQDDHDQHDDPSHGELPPGYPEGTIGPEGRWPYG